MKNLKLYKGLFMATILTTGVMMVGCSNGTEVIETQPIEEVQVDPAVEEAEELVVEEPEPEIIESEIVPQKVSDAELERYLRSLSPNSINHALRNDMDNIVAFVVYESEGLTRGQRESAWVGFDSVMEHEATISNFGLLPMLRDNQTNSTLIKMYDMLIDLNNRRINGEIDLSEYTLRSRDIAKAIENSDISGHEALILSQAYVGSFNATNVDATKVTLEGETYTLMTLLHGPTDVKRKDPLRLIWWQLSTQYNEGNDMSIPYKDTRFAGTNPKTSMNIDLDDNQVTLYNKGKARV